MLRVLALGCGAACSRPPVLAAGLGSVSGAMSVCTQPKCGTHTPPWSGWLALNSQIKPSATSSVIGVPGATGAWSCRTKMLVVAACGRGTKAKSLFGLTSWRCSRRAPPAHSRMWWRGCRRPPSVLCRQRGPCSCVVVAWGVGGEWSPGPGPVWCQSGRGALGWCQGVPQARSPGRAPVLANRTWQWAVSHRISEGRRCLLFPCLLLGRTRLALVVAVRPSCPSGLAALWLGWGTPWCTGRVGWVAGACVRDRCHRALLARGGGVGGFVPPPPVPAVGRRRVPLAVCPWHAVPPAAGRPPTLGGRQRTSWTFSLLPDRGRCGALPVALARLAWEW